MRAEGLYRSELDLTPRLKSYWIFALLLFILFSVIRLMACIPQLLKKKYNDGQFRTLRFEIRFLNLISYFFKVTN